jgi:hypothetical protein
MVTGFRRCIPFAAILLVATAVSAHAVDEIQVYNAEIAKVGQWTFQLHSNYAFIGRKEPDFPGGLIPNHALQGTGEWAWGITDWWEMGFYTPYAVDQELTPYSNAAKIRAANIKPQAKSPPKIGKTFHNVSFGERSRSVYFRLCPQKCELEPVAAAQTEVAARHPSPRTRAVRRLGHGVLRALRRHAIRAGREITVRAIPPVQPRPMNDFIEFGRTVAS